MKNIRKQTFTLEQYLKDMKAEKIRTDQECQRLSGQWNPNMVNELIASVLTDDYIPPIILGEETTSNGITRQWIIDGLQRSSTLSLFKYGNTKITKNLDEYMVTYQRKATDEDGNIKRDEQGEIVWENLDFDIRNKTYEQLPEELKEIFNGYQMEVVIHQNCDTMEISKLVRKLNNCKPMNQAQRAFTYIDAFAREIREIADNRFFKDMYSCNNKDRINGTFEREKELITKQDQMVYEMILGLRKLKGVSCKDFYQKYGQTIEKTFHLGKLRNQHQVKSDGNFIWIPEDLLYVSNDILVEFVGE